MSDTVKSLLFQLETELKHQLLWSDKPLEAAERASTLPFCCDTLRLEQWLQFVYIPRLWALLDAGLALPAKASVLPYAQEVLKGRNEVSAYLLQIISQLDMQLSGDI
jgi:uncharacterized protein YqcC (DUF446 family)